SFGEVGGDRGPGMVAGAAIAGPRSCPYVSWVVGVWGVTGGCGGRWVLIGLLWLRCVVGWGDSWRWSRVRLAFVGVVIRWSRSQVVTCFPQWAVGPSAAGKAMDAGRRTRLIVVSNGRQGACRKIVCRLTCFNRF